MTRNRKVQVWILGKDEEGQGRILLLQTKPERGGFWQPVTGHVETGEAFEEAAEREAREETGLNFLRKPKSLQFEFEFEKNGVQFREKVFSIECKLSKIRMDPHEHVAWKWVGPDEASEMLRFKVHRDALKLIRF